MSSTSSSELGTSPTTDDDVRWKRKLDKKLLKQQQQNDDDVSDGGGTGTQGTQGTEATESTENSSNADGVAYHIETIEDSDKWRGIVSFTFTWADYDDASEDFCYVMRSQGPAMKYYQEWTAHPKDEDKGRNAKDIVAGNPHYRHIDIGLWSLVESIFDDVKTHKRVREYSDLALKNDVFEILCSVPLVVLRGICGAGLQARKIRDEELYAWLSNTLRKSTDPSKRPCIYVLELTSSRGRPPTLGHMREFARCARAYLKPSSQADYDIIVRVDQHCKEDFDSDDEDERRSLATRTWLPTAKRGKNLKRLEKFLDELDKRIDEFAISNGDNVDFPHPLRDVGYSDDSYARLEQQETMSQSSNRFLSLFNAIAQSHPDQSIQKRHYRAWGNVVFLGFRQSHAMLGEIVFSVLAQSYHWTGKGFNSVDAGVQNTSNDKYGFADFSAWREDIFESSPYKPNAAAETRRVEELLAEGSRLETEEEELELETLRQSLSALYVVEDGVEAFKRAIGELS